MNKETCKLFYITASLFFYLTGAWALVHALGWTAFSGIFIWTVACNLDNRLKYRKL